MQFQRAVEEHVSSPRRLIVDHRTGELVIVGEERNDVLVTAHISIEADDERDGQARLAGLRLPISTSAGALVIGPPHSAIGPAGGLSPEARQQGACGPTTAYAGTIRIVPLDRGLPLRSH